ncbi:male-specific lethal 3 homolog [Metopolophium dirhodum]|uniref:male-specific lethal 3 homolog n=1 Tax=Metopolophium dirhodum TaxID=44670 RepID=UPI0029903628|nr:male-specific lethal 3 homolog [Metopolophium dirhodum]
MALSIRTLNMTSLLMKCCRIGSSAFTSLPFTWSLSYFLCSFVGWLFFGLQEISTSNHPRKIDKTNLCYLAFPDSNSRLREKNKLIRLPCQPNVVTLLENYHRYLESVSLVIIKQLKKKRQLEVFDKKQLEKCYTLCIEVLDGLRICFNTFLFGMLVVNKDEQAQYYEALQVTLQPPVNNIISQNGEQGYDNVPNYEELEIRDNKNNIKAKRSRRPTSQYASSDCSLTKSHRSKILKDTFEKTRDEDVLKADSWKAVPDSAYDEEIKQIAIVYGVYHLLWLLGTSQLKRICLGCSKL